MATPNAIAVALFNAAAGGYTAQIAADPNSLANAAGLILEKDISNDALFVEHLLSNFGVMTSMPIYMQARSELFNLVTTQGRGKAVTAAIDFLKAQEGAWNDYALVALNFAVKVSEATVYSANNPTQRDISKLVAGVTGVDTDQLAIADALAATNPAFSASLQSAVAAATAAAQAEKTAALAAQKSYLDAIAKSAADKAAADLKVAQDKATADAAAAKAAYDKVLADTAATLKAADNLALEAAIKAAADKAAAAAAVDKASDNAAAITAFLKTTAASLGLTGYESMTDTQLVNIIKYSDNQTIASAVDKTTDNATAISNYLKSEAAKLQITGYSTMTDSQLVTAIRTSNDTAIAAAVDRTTDNATAISTNLKTVAASLEITGYSTMTDSQLITAIRTSNDAAIAAAVDRTTDNSTAISTYLRNAAAALNVTGTGSMTDTQLIDAIKTANDAQVTSALQTQIDQLTSLTGRTFALSLDNDTILAVSGGNDTITGTNLTYATDDMVVDTSLTDNDIFTLSTANDITATPVIVGMENLNVNVTSVYAGDSGPTSLAFNADNIRNSELNFDVTNSSSVVTDLVLTYLPIGVPVTTSNEFTTVSISADDNAVVNYTGYATTLTLNSPGTLMDVFATVNATTAGTVTTDTDATATVATAADTTVTASTAVAVDITSAGQATVIANSANSVKVTATEEALITANAAENVTIIAGDGIDTISASAIDSTLTSTNANTMTVNVAGNTSSAIVDISDAPNVDHVNISGSPNVTLKVSLVGIDGLGTSTTGTTADDNLLYVSKANTGTATIWIKTTGGDADFSQAIVSSIVVAAALTSTDDLTVASNAVIETAADQNLDLDIIAKNSLTASTNAVNVTVRNNSAAGVDGDLTGGLTLTSFGTATLTNADANAQAALGAVSALGTALTIASGTQGFAASSSINLNTANLSVTGSGPVNLGSAVTAGSILGASTYGAITLGLSGLDYVGTVTTGSGNDVLTISNAVLNNTRSYALTTGSGTDSVTLSIAQDFTWSAGADYDSLKIVGDLDLSSATITLTSVDEIQLDSASGGDKTVTINPTTFSSNNIFNLRGNSAGSDVLVVQGTASAETINANQVAVDPNYAALKLNGAAGNDTITGSAWADSINGGSGNDLLSGGYYGDTYIYNTGDVDGGETIVEPTSGSETDIISVVTTIDFTNMTASSFDEIESIVIASGQTVTFTGLQLTGESIALTGDSGSETIIVNIGEGQQFTSLLTNSPANFESVQYIGTTGAESIAGGAMTETITGGTGNDLLSGGAGNDTFIFSSYSTNGLDRLTLSVTGAATVDDKLNFAINTFINDGTPQIGYITDSSITSAITTDTLNDNVLILKTAYFADATALEDATTLFTDIAAANGNVLIIYASSSTTDARIAFATVTNDGDINDATDVAVLVGLTVANAFDYFVDGNFIL